MIMIGASAGFTLRYVGLLGRLLGRKLRAALIADSTSRVAASMLRFKSNCSVMLACPRVLCEVISVTEEMRPNSRSSGVATDEAMISGLAPGSEADTDTVGKSTCGRGETGSTLKDAAPVSTIAAVNSVVAIGRLRMRRR